MEKRLRHRRVGMFLGLAAGVLLVGAGCEPLINPPPGGGETITQTFRYGPFTIATGGQVMGSPSSGLPRPAGSFGLKGARFDLVDQNGIPYQQHEVHLHHIVMTTTARTDALCPGRAERFTGSGTERTPLTLWGPYTYLVGANDQWGAIYHLMNMNPPNSPPLIVYIQYTLDYQPGANATNSRPVQPLFQDVTGCGGSTFDVPGNGGSGSFYYKSRAWQATRDGIAVFTAAHLHEGGISNTLKDDSTGTRICKSDVEYHHPDEFRHVEAIGSCVLHEKVTPGHNYKLTTKYDNSRPWLDVMGINLTYVWWGTQQ
jgi:hypothetical protein